MTELERQINDENMFHAGAKDALSRGIKRIHIECFNEADASFAKMFFSVNYPEIEISVSWLNFHYSPPTAPPNQTPM